MWLCRSVLGLRLLPFPFSLPSFYHTLPSWSGGEGGFCFAPGLQAMKPEGHRLEFNETAAQTDFSSYKLSLMYLVTEVRGLPRVGVTVAVESGTLLLL